MDLHHRFSVPATPDEAWHAFAQLGRLAPCFPGATVSSLEGGDFTGSVKIKLGPLALVYRGRGRYVGRDQDAGRCVIEATGTDTRGNGSATALLTITLTGDGDLTEVDVATVLTLTGRPAAFGRSVVADASDRVVDQFVSCISPRFADGLGDPAPHPGPDPEPHPGPDPEPHPEPDPEPHPEPVEGQPRTRPEPVEDLTLRAARPSTSKISADTPSDEASRTDVQVVSTVVPPLLKRHWPWTAGFLVAVLAVLRTVRSVRR